MYDIADISDTARHGHDIVLDRYREFGNAIRMKSQAPLNFKTLIMFLLSTI